MQSKKIHPVKSGWDLNTLVKGICMKKEFLETGKIVGTHGIKGMVRINPWADDGDFLCRFKRLFIGNAKKEIKVSDIRPAGRVVIAKLDGIDSVEAAERLRDSTVYIKRDDVDLPPDRYFVSEIIGSKVYNAKDDSLLGTLSNVSETGANDVWHIEKGGKEYLVPAIDEVIALVDIENDTIKINVMEGIFDED